MKHALSVSKKDIKLKKVDWLTDWLIDEGVDTKFGYPSTLLII